jgi:hypothetical protein
LPKYRALVDSIVHLGDLVIGDGDDILGVPSMRPRPCWPRLSTKVCSKRRVSVIMVASKLGVHDV